MSAFNGKIDLKLLAIALFLLVILPKRAECQISILDSAFTFKNGTVKTGNALDIITRQTGYNFTYDNRLIDQEKKVQMTFRQTRLRVILDSLLKNDSLVFSVIDKYIIIARVANRNSSVDSTLAKVRYITGKIRDNETQEPLPFATVALKNTGKGTVSNNNGEFGLKVTPDHFNDTLSVSFLGYLKKEIPVKNSFGSDFTISMQREFISIPEIIIRNQNPVEIVVHAFKSIAKNYGNTPASMTGFYREGVMKKSELQTYSEAILQIYKSAYAGTLFGDQIKVYKSRKIENINRHDTLAIRLKAGLSTCLELDGAKNTFDFLTNISDYSYRLTDIVTYDDETAYAIEFEQHENVDLPLFKGTIYINSADYGILGAEFEINPQLIYKMKGSFISTTSHGFNTWPTAVSYSVTYRKIKERYFLSHVRGDLTFTSSQKRKLFHSQFKVFFELAITETSLTNVKRFDRDEVAPIHSIFSNTVINYDPQFWGDLDFLRPEEDLQKALKNMNMKIQESK